MPGIPGPTTAAQGAQAVTHQTIVQQAAAKYGIPAWILWGVYGLETGYGSNVTTSSAGAVGSFQFLPSTAASYGYPVTNATDPGTFTAQADAAAHYLSDLFRRAGNWNSALQSYSGGGYGEAQVRAKNASGGGAAGAVLGAIGNVASAPINAASSVVSGVSGAASGVSSIANFLTNATNWLRIAEVIAGVILVAMGLRSLTGNTTSPVTLATSAAKAIK